MGNVVAFSGDSLDQHQTHKELRIQLDLAKPIHQSIKQLQHWSLEQIRNIYAPFRKRRSSPLLTRSEFLRFVRLSRISAFHIFDQLCKVDSINAFQLMAILVLGAFTTYAYKLQFLFNVFDLLSLKKLKFTGLILMFKSVVRGFAFLTAQTLPQVDLLDKYATAIFSRADLNNDQSLQLAQIITWVEQNKDAMQLFKRFQPKSYGKQEYYILTGFLPYKQQQIDIMLTRIKQAHANHKLQNEDFQLLTTKEPLLRKMSVQIDQNKQNAKTNFISKIIKKNRVSVNARPGNNSSTILKREPQNSKSPAKLLKASYGNRTFASDFRCQLGEGKWRTKRSHFNNIIIIKGRTITKRQVFELKDYFDLLAKGKENILIEDFIESFSQQKYNHMKSVAASLYNFLDHDQNGKVNFRELIISIYPHLTAQHFQLIDSWCQQYHKNFVLKKEIKRTHTQEQIKKRVLPRACLSRFGEMFDFYDRNRKGYIDIDDMRRVLSQVCTEKQILDLFEDSDRDRDGRITLQEFSYLILPLDLEIQGLL